MTRRRRRRWCARHGRERAHVTWAVFLLRCAHRSNTSCFFSSRRRHTSWTGDWSSTCALPISRGQREAALKEVEARLPADKLAKFYELRDARSEERRVGKEGRAGGAA